MNVLEDRLRAELRAESELIAPESIPALRLPGRDRGGLTALRRRGTGRWPAWVAPAAAAAAVIAVIAGTFTVSQLGSGGVPNQHEAANWASYSSLPPYYAQTVEGKVVSYTFKGSQNVSTVLGRYIKVRATGTGKLVTTVSAPRPYNNFIVLTGSEDGRTFVFGAERYWGFRGNRSPYTGALDASAPVKFFTLRIGPDGHAHLSGLPVPFTILPGQQPSIALSPDGTRLAVAYGGGQAALVRVVTLATGEVRQWQWPHASWTPLLLGQGGWTADGRTLVVEQWYVIRGASGKAPKRDTPVSTAPTWLLDTATPGGAGSAAGRLLVLPAPAGMSAPWLPFITPDGSELIATADRVGRSLRGPSAGELAVYSARTGALIRTLAPWKWHRAGPFPSAAVAWSDRSGSQLLLVLPRGGVNRLGVLTGNTVRLTGSDLLPSDPDGYAKLQGALLGVAAIPQSMAW